jgi:NADPH:quinone reductase-like Zn-dependent oxidoreductase
MIEGAALPEAIFTVWSNLFGLGGAKRGDTVLVHGGTSGIGTTAIMMGKMFELEVIVTAGSDEKCARAKELGAVRAVNYNQGDWMEAVHEQTGGRGVQIVLDMVGGDYVVPNLMCLAEGGRHVSIAAQRGANVELPLWTIMRRRLTLTGSTLRARTVEFKSGLATEIQRKVWPFLEMGRMRPVIDTVFPLHRAAKAHARMESGKHIGKIMLEVADPTYP